MNLPENFTEMLKNLLTLLSTIVRVLGFTDVADEIDRRIADEDGIPDEDDTK